MSGAKGGTRRNGARTESGIPSLRQELVRAVREGPGAKDRLVEALRHPSWCKEWRETTGQWLPSNERLEFLGDAVIGLAVAAEIFQRFSGLSEGDLAKIRASVVNRESLARAGRELGLDKLVFVAGPLRDSSGDVSDSIVEDCFEAVVGAYFLTKGYRAAMKLVKEVLSPRLKEEAMAPGQDDHKTRLQEEAIARFREQPSYETTKEGPDHNPTFRAVVTVAGRTLGEGHGSSKRRAEQMAARAARAALGTLPRRGTGSEQRPRAPREAAG
jgi:ribonuclease-3